jgi:N-acetylmuramoyl-L-alanine amidase
MKSLYLLLLVSFNTFVLVAQKNSLTVVIDPGHGGTDPGHLSENTKLLPEKDLNLALSKKIGDYILSNLDNVHVVYTRNSDHFVSLDDRVAKANAVNADYFISIHCNANHNKNIHGTESHVHSLKSAKSVALAYEFERQFSTRAGRKSRGVKDSEDREHSLHVLKFTNMTSVLVEFGFLTNAHEANYLNTTYGQDILASAAFRAFRTFIQKEHPQLSILKTQSSTASKPTQNQFSGSYTIQLLSSRTAMDTQLEQFKRIGLPVERKMLSTTSAYKYLYTSGKYPSISAAQKDLQQIQRNGFKDAFIIKATR